MAASVAPGTIDAMTILTADVAATAPFPDLFEVVGVEDVHGQPWSALKRAMVEVDETQTLRHLLRQACVPLGVSLNPRAIDVLSELAAADGKPSPSPDPADHLVFIGFRQPDDDLPTLDAPEAGVVRRDTRLHQRTAVVRDGAGCAVWRRPGLDATMKELVDAATAGLVDGDPLQPYLIPSIPQGDLGGVDTWIAFRDAIIVLWGVAGAIATVDGVLGVAERLTKVRQRRSRAMTRAVERHAASWHDRGAAPSDLLRMLSQRPRTTDEVAALLGCTPDEAGALLWGFGFVHDNERGVWLHCGDDVAQLIADDLDLTFWLAGASPDRKQLVRTLLTQRLAGTIETGRAPPIEEAQAEMRLEMYRELDADDAVVRAPTRLGRLVARWRK